MSEAVQKMLVIVLAIAVIGGIGLGYSALAYHNGTDMTKDTVFVALIGGLSSLATKFLSGSNAP